MFKFSKNKPVLIGWVTKSKYCRPVSYLFDRLRPDKQMRFRPVAEWINKNIPNIHNEIYNPNRRYDIVVFLKIMTERAMSEVGKIKSYGGKVVFDANVNYYEIWGDYHVPGTKPTEKQSKQAIWITRNADFVVADSTYIRNICLGFNQNVVWIPDNVDVCGQYTGLKEHIEKKKLTLVWSGQLKKAFHFELIEDSLYNYAERIKILIVTNKEFVGNLLPHVVHRMKKRLDCEIRVWRPSRYPVDLLGADVIISPKILNNGYEMGHSEYKITLGMAQRLPVIASNQQSYIDAFGGMKAGFICKDKKDWHNAFKRLLDSALTRQEMGDIARECVVEKYSVEVVSRQYADIFNKLMY
ncbi:MAG: hypothetical protein HOG49_20290 [Candidatus Scalindua sp.]|jgi:glycosyltransferase involved in cell wall biosynthesis|nr:hypothetical protein [Candidatus Scalindua sp.]